MEKSDADSDKKIQRNGNLAEVSNSTNNDLRVRSCFVRVIVGNFEIVLVWYGNEYAERWG